MVQGVSHRPVGGSAGVQPALTPVRLRWRKRRWACPNPECAVASFIEQDPTIGPQRALLTSRAARWVTVQVGRRGRSVDEVAAELGCDWHTVNNEVRRWGEALLEADGDRVEAVEAVGVDETLFWRKGRWRTKQWCTSVVDVGGHQLIDIVAGRTANSAEAWFRSQPAEWLDGIRWAVLDMSGPYRKAYDRVLPNALQVADPLHVIRLANQRLDEVRRRVQNETLGHRGRKADPLYRIRSLLTAAHERISDRGRTRLRGLLDAGDPTAKSAPPGTLRKPSETSTGSTNRSSRSATLSSSLTTSKTNPALPRSTNWAGPSPAGHPRSPTGTSPR